jgi:hypothetical protein
MLLLLSGPDFFFSATPTLEWSFDVIVPDVLPIMFPLSLNVGWYCAGRNLDLSDLARWPYW